MYINTKILFRYVIIRIKIMKKKSNALFKKKYLFAYLILIIDNIFFSNI